MQDAPKAVWSIPYVSVAFFSTLNQNFIAYRISKVSDCIFEIHQLWQSGFSRVYSNCCCNCSFETEIIKIGQSSHKMYSNNILNFQESTTILNACTKKSGSLLKAPRIYIVKISAKIEENRLSWVFIYFLKSFGLKMLHQTMTGKIYLAYIKLSLVPYKRGVIRSCRIFYKGSKNPN